MGAATAAATTPLFAAKVAGKDKVTIALVPGLTADGFYVTMHHGAQAAAKAVGAELVYQGAAEWNVSLQVPVLDAVIARKPDAIMIAPTDKVQLIAPLKKAHDAGIAIVCVDTYIGTGVFQTGSGDADFPISYVASDNVLGGRMAARALAEAIGEKGKVYVSNVKPGISTTDQREEGFKDEMKKYSGVQVLETQFNDDDANKAAAQVQAVFGRVPDLAGVFGANLFSASGTANGVTQAGQAGKIKIAGFDAPESSRAPAQGWHLHIDYRPASRRNRVFRLHRRLRPCHGQSGSDRHRNWLYGDDQSQYRRSEGLQVSLQEQLSMCS